MAMDQYELTSAWQQVYDGGSNGNVVIQSSGPCEIAIGDEPAGASLNYAIQLREKPAGSGYEFAASGLTDVFIWARETYQKDVIMNVANW